MSNPTFRSSLAPTTTTSLSAWFDKHIVVDDPYRQAATAVIEQRLAQAGIRLAMILNAAAH
jgi:hypothetical protein